MARLIYSSVLLTLYLSLQAFLGSNAQLTDFLSIDCGATNPYNDVQLGLKWETDDNYIKTGVTKRMKEAQDFPKQLYSYRSFPSRSNKNCYIMPVITHTTYLLRVRLFPGVVGEKYSVALPVDFNVTFVSNLFFTYSALTDKDRVDVIYESVFHSFQREEISLCLLQGSKGTPFINSIELRGLPDTSYHVTRDVGDAKVLVLGERLNMGTKPGDNSFFRYPDDEFDRFWWSTPRTRFPFNRVDGSSMIGDLFFKFYEPNTNRIGENWPPNRTYIDAWVGPEFSFELPRKREDTNKIYTAFYFKDVRPDSQANFSNYSFVEWITVTVGDVSDNIWLCCLRDENWGVFEDVQLYDRFIHVNVSHKNDSSIESIVLNGFEYYYKYDFDISSTYSRDIRAVGDLLVSFQLEDFQGDPCFPVSWDWLTCDLDASRIQKLKLSHMNISGPIPENISSLVELTEIYLDNNNLEGPIPYSLTSLTKLRIL
ncbi:hypothetical protein R1flu_009124 [Riccia fluitans]|uniref:Malectin-like domain-containing protein n=1 Tax=Riccia fluitans TaxID=41844 RepID=A0ABD1Z5B9_9MARC